MKGKLFTAALIAAIVITCAAFGGCASFTTQHQQIAVACESSATAADAIAAGVDAGRVTSAQANQALTIYQVTVPFCEPQPLEQLSQVDYIALVTAAAELTTLSENTR
jgi:hypothetical protein